MASFSVLARRFASTNASAVQPSIARTFTPGVPSTFPSVQQTMTKHNYHEYQHAAKSTSTWFWICVVGVIPPLLAVASYSVPIELEHLQHLKEHPREFEPLPYMRKRQSKVPWGGDDCLFYNPNSNPRPE